MKVKIVRKAIDPMTKKEMYPDASWPDFGVKFKPVGDAELRPYSNGIDGKPDPQII